MGRRHFARGSWGWLLLATVLAFLWLAANRVEAADGGHPAQAGTAAKVETPPPPPSPMLGWCIAGVLVAVILTLVATAFLVKRRDRSQIQELGPSFFFWVNVARFVILFCVALAYSSNALGVQSVIPPLIGSVLPIAVPWFGALGAVMISMQGIFEHNAPRGQGSNGGWDPKYNYWHLARPFFGAALAIVAYFMLILINAVSGTAPKFLTLSPGTAGPAAPDLSYVVYYVLAFLVGYREATFRKLIAQVTDIVLGPGQKQNDGGHRGTGPGQGGGGGGSGTAPSGGGS